jgi:8-oxo-dGTP pyrophosphatase MutT (NUDIX family)
MNFDSFLIALSKIENLELPGQVSQFKMSPPFREELIESQKDKIPFAKQAAVMALFYPDFENKTHLILILRKTYKGVHSAQIGFPGGKLEIGETLQEAAIRETFEEVGVEAQEMEVLKPMTQVYIPPSNYYVHPFLGICKRTPNFIKQDEEVDDIIEVKLSHFLDDTIITTKSVATSYNVTVEVPAFKLNNHIVWGATAMMLSEVKDLLKLVL